MFGNAFIVFVLMPIVSVRLVRVAATAIAAVLLHFQMGIGHNRGMQRT